MQLIDMLKFMVENNGSDLYLTTYAKPSVKLQGKLTPIPGYENMEPGDVHKLALSVMRPDQKQEFEEHLEINLAISEEGVGRFRVNAFNQRNEVSMVIRSISTEIPTAEQLNLPPVLLDVIMEKRGLVLFVGATGSGKSTSLAGLINHRNQNSAGHIITIEDPVEFVHPHHQCIVNQREVGVDTLSYEEALKNTLRQAPDVILIGEIRSQETMEHAIAFAETGHLCLSTLHANNANQAMDRIINFFPEERKNQLLLDLSFNMKAIISQRLVPTVDKKRAAAIEIMLGSPLICEAIKRGDIDQLKEIMEKSGGIGMQTFDGALYKLYMDGVISYDEALRNADSKNNLRLKISLEESDGENSEGGSSLSLKATEEHDGPEAVADSGGQDKPTGKPKDDNSGLASKLDGD